jgi:hypothetical protein
MDRERFSEGLRDLAGATRRLADSIDDPVMRQRLGDMADELDDLARAERTVSPRPRTGHDLC